VRGLLSDWQSYRNGCHIRWHITTTLFCSGDDTTIMATDFIPGLELSGLFYREIIKPILDEHFDFLQYSAALIGAGSEVLAFDTVMSRDHDWGPRLKLFLNESDYSNNAKVIEETLQRHLPDQFRGFSVQWVISGPTNNRCVELLTIRDFFQQYLNFDIRCEFEPADWLTFPEHKLRTLRLSKKY